MGFFLIFFLIKNEKLWVRNRSHPEFCGDPIFCENFSKRKVFRFKVSKKILERHADFVESFENTAPAF